MKVALAYHQARGQRGQDDVRLARACATTASISAASRCRAWSTTGASSARRCPALRTCGIRISRRTSSRAAKAPHGAELADDLTRFVNLYGAENIAACFVEPIAGSTGCLVPPKGYLKRLREICDTHGILLVFDEVITGFGPHRADISRRSRSA